MTVPQDYHMLPLLLQIGKAPHNPDIHVLPEKHLAYRLFESFFSRSRDACSHYDPVPVLDDFHSIQNVHAPDSGIPSSKYNRPGRFRHNT